MSTTKLKDMTYVESFSRQQGDYEWTGLMKIKASKLKAGVGHVYQLVEELLPLEMLYIRTKEIDTMRDYENAISWYRNGYIE